MDCELALFVITNRESRCTKQSFPLSISFFFIPHANEEFLLSRVSYIFFLSYRPLENDISTWNYELVATDSEGANVTDSLDIHVQQHKSSRSVNHEFSIYLRIDKRNEFPTNIDWELKVRSLLPCIFFLFIL